MSVQHVYIVGSKGAGNYGGFETFVDKLTEYHQDNKNIQYHIAWKGTEFKEFEHNGAHSFQIKVPNIGPAQAIYYDVIALNYCIKHIKENDIKNPIIYILACRIGPFAKHYQRLIHKLGGKLYVNPDGHEWMRAKWSAPVRKYWKLSEKLMVKHADLLICDSKNIEKYVISEYQSFNPKTKFIAYGADLSKSNLADDSQEVMDWYTKFSIVPFEYYLIVGRFVPENSFDIMISEFLKSNTSKDLVIITTENKKMMKDLQARTNYKSDKRIKFVGTVYNQELLRKIRENAFGYLHGHTVGGTNPSLIEALSSTKLNLLVDVGFNREVAEDGALYWKREANSLAEVVNKVESLSKDEIEELSNNAKKRIYENYTWKYITNKYLECFL